jgi:hypothetical protein
MAATPVKGYQITLKVGAKIILGLETLGFSQKPNFEEIALKEDAGNAMEELIDFDSTFTATSRTYKITSESATHHDYNTLRLAARAGTAIAFVYGEFVNGKKIVTGNAYITGYTEDADSTKGTGKYTLTLEAVKGSVNFTTYS